MDSQRCDPGHFRKACGKFPTSVTVTTVMGDDGQSYGLILNAFVSVSLGPAYGACLP
jgi:flavin reductase (DIM6/NTAB) family NADH-FMN oxidoreductase RutF